MMAMIASNILLVIIGICLYSKHIIRNTGYRILIIFLAMTFLRFLFPLELPFSVTVTLSEEVSDRLIAIYSPIITIFHYPVSVIQLLIVIWIIGIIYFLLRYSNNIRKSRRLLKINGWDITGEEPYASCIERICRERNKRNRFQLIRTTLVKVPMVYGILKPCILIPTDFEADESKLYYVLCHEASHYFHHDLLVKACINFLAIIYWWNPFVYLVKKQAGLLLEMRVDDRVIDGDPEKSREYLNCLLEIAENLEESAGENEINEGLSLAFFKGKTSELERRFGMIINGRRKKMWVNVLLVVVITGIYLFSYQFNFVAYYSPYNVIRDNSEKSAYIFPQAEEIYAIENEDGTYSIYYENSSLSGDFFMEKVDELKNSMGAGRIYYLEKGKYKDK